MLKLSLASLSGGQGKTTVSLFLGKLLAAKGLNVLLVDADPQASLTFYLGMEVQEATNTLYEVFTNEVAIAEAIYPTDTANVFLVPADKGLNGAQDWIAKSGAGAVLLKKRLKPIEGKYDVCIIDSPPQGFLLALSAMAASDRVLIPAEAGSKGSASVVKTLEAIYELQDLEIFGGQVLGIVPFRDKWSGRNQTECSREAINTMRRVAEGIPIFPSILESEAFRKSLDQGKVPTELKPEVCHPLEVIIQKLEEQCLIPVQAIA